MFDQAVDILKNEHNINVSKAELQHILWQREQRLWGAKNETNLAEAAARRFGGESVPPIRFSYNDQAPAGFSEGDRLAEQERGVLEKTRQSVDFEDGGGIRQGKAAYQSGGRAETLYPRLLDGIEVDTSKSFKPRLKFKNDVNSIATDDGRAAYTAPNFHEIESPDVFSKAQGNAALSLGDPDRTGQDQYQPLDQARKIISDDGGAGFTLHGVEIGAMFHHADSDYHGVQPAMLQLATELGGRKLTIPDDHVAVGAARSGFRVAARTKGEPGQPDTLHMVFDPQHHGRFNANEGVTVNSPEEARQAQDQMLQEIANRPKNPHRFEIDEYHIARQNPNQFTSYNDINSAVHATLHPDYYFGGGKQMGEQRNVLPLGQDRYLSVIHSTKGNSTKVHEAHVISRSDLDQLRQR